MINTIGSNTYMPNNLNRLSLRLIRTVQCVSSCCQQPSII